MHKGFCLGLVLLLSISTAPAANGQASTQQNLDRYLQRLTAFGFSGTVLVARNGHVLLAKGYGLADRGKHIAMTKDTVISIGSITKQFTAAAILRLEQQGKLSVTDPIVKFFPNAPSDKAGITIHQLLTHTAGLASDYGGDYEPLSRDAFVARVFSRPLENPPGKVFSYANAGYSLLAAIVEIVSGRSYEAYLHEKLFVPAGMLHTGYRIPRWDTSKIAIGYRDGVPWGTIMSRPWAPDGPYWNLRGNGAIHSTIGDMYAWDIALRAHTVLNAKEVAEFQTPYVNEGPAGLQRYAYGWSVMRGPRGRLIAHNGGNGIFAADFLRYVDAGITVYAASNQTEIPAIEISTTLARIAFGAPYVEPPETAAISRAAVQRVTGAYALASGARVDVGPADNGISITASNADGVAALLGAAPGALPPYASSIAQKTLAVIHGTGGAEDQFEAPAGAGALRDAVVLGVAPERDNVAAFATLTFANLTKTYAFIWGPRHLLNIRPLERGPSLRLVAQDALHFVAFDPAGPDPRTRRAAFTRDAQTMTLQTPAGTVSATRIP